MNNLNIPARIIVTARWNLVLSWSLCLFYLLLLLQKYCQNTSAPVLLIIVPVSLLETETNNNLYYMPAPLDKCL